jgi:hypothetical protein
VSDFQRKPGRIGPWRLLDIAQAVLPFRGSFLGAGAMLPEYGPPDAPAANQDPAEELPDSNISEGEQRQAVRREQARRFVRTPRPHR